jgi:ATP-dependent Lon protease
MTKDIQNKISKKEQRKKSEKKASDVSLKKKKQSESDSDSVETDSESDDMNVHEYRKFLAKIFPSKHLNQKIKAGENLQNEIVKKLDKKNKGKKKAEKEEEDTESEEEKSPKNKKGKDKKKKGKKVVELDTEDEDEDDSEYIEETEDDDDDDDEDEDDEEDEEDEVISDKKSNKINIIFTIGGAEDEDEDEWEDEDDSDYEDSDDDEDTEDEDASVSSDSSEEEEVVSKKKGTKKEEKKEKVEKEEKVDKKEKVDKTGTEDSNDVLFKLKELCQNNKNNKSIQKCIEAYEEDIKTTKTRQDKKMQKQKERNNRIFKKIVKDKNTMNDFAFYEKLDIQEQKKIIKELREINKITRIQKPYRITLLESDMPTLFKGAAMKKINSLRYMEPGSGEFYKIKNWVDTFMRIPFNSYQTLPISIDDGVDKCHEFMEAAQNTLNSAVYGLNDAKMQILQMLGQLVTNPKSIGTAIAIHGPPGTGKTSLVKEGISKILNRPFAFIALGGATDSSFLEGHSYTYEGSTWGKIVQILIDSKCMNPVIYFDELDKISDTPRGEEIAGILTHLTDTSQNSQFHDKYFAEINFDLSKCLFIFSYNDESKVNPILKDRMYRIQTKGYNQKQKTVIGNDYLLPKIREQVKFEQKDIIIPDDTLHYIIDNYCNKEDGVRNLKRCLEIIYTKLNLYRLMKPDSNLFEEDMSLKVEFPFTVSKEIVDKLIKKDDNNVSAMYSMYV